MGELNLYTEFSIPSDINRSYICADWSMIWASESKYMKNLAMKKKKTLFLWLLCKVLFLSIFTDKTWEAILRMSMHELIPLPFTEKYAKYLLQWKPMNLSPDVFNHAMGSESMDKKLLFL